MPNPYVNNTPIPLRRAAAALLQALEDPDLLLAVQLYNYHNKDTPLRLPDALLKECLNGIAQGDTIHGKLTPKQMEELEAIRKILYQYPLKFRLLDVEDTHNRKPEWIKAQAMSEAPEHHPKTCIYINNTYPTETSSRPLGSDFSQKYGMTRGDRVLVGNKAKTFSNNLHALESSSPNRSQGRERQR